MANILISYFSDYGEVMYDSISKVLLENGNSVFRLNINNPLQVNITKWGGESTIIDEDLLDLIANFNPDLIFSYNNCLPVNLYKVLNKNCKICVLDADAPEVAFWNKNIFNKYFNRLIFCGLQSCSKTMYEKYLKTQLNKNYIYFPPATLVKNEPLVQDKNISFIGSNFYPLSIPKCQDFYSDDALKLYSAFRENYFLSFKEAKKICKSFTLDSKLFEEIRAFYVGQERLKYMQILTDLGFVFYGCRWWNKIAYYDFELAKCFDKTPIVSLEDNQWVYNTSKISINISHQLAKTSFSWRVMDIMASNSCLLMEEKPDWKNLFEQYISKEVLEAIIYKDKFDLRKKAIILINNEDLRQQCIKELNNAVEQNGRWEKRFKCLESKINIPILGLKENINIQYMLNVKYIVNLKKEQKQRKEFLHNLKIKQRFKIIIYAFIIILGQIPIIDLIIKKTVRKKLLGKLQQYWR